MSYDSVMTLRTVLGAKGTSRAELYKEINHETIIADQKWVTSVVKGTLVIDLKNELL